MKRREKILLEEGQALVVADITMWEHMAMVYRTLAERARTSDEEEGPEWWDDFADHVEYWVKQTRFDYEEKR